ncbi:MAG TPA: NAD-dependent epimerase/dehydratase family protein [bacterium]|nr:NAD-dependent epimerase/dehydratase family protein [bacterium]HQI48852.1 NAD-dependent epimerase/dehydratase family protein [bacterium]HQJ65404.1 NAD-dependent epimerase/dehydratase family protein [bacterium]
MKILVTGGAGFIASQITDAYIAAGHQVVVLDNLVTGKRENLNPEATFYQMDIQDPALVEVFKRHQFDIVNHHAAQMDVRRSVEDPIYDARNNVLGFLNILQASAKTGVKRVIFASSGGAIYGEQDSFPADERHKTQPCSPYGITKLVGEKYLFFYSQTWGIGHTILRYANVYGPRQNPHGEAGVVAIFCSRLLAGEEPVINGTGEQTRDFVFVADVVAANLLALAQTSNDTFNIGTGHESTINEVYRTLNALIGSNKPEKHGPAKEGEQFRSVIDASHAARMLGWKPRFTLETGLHETVEFFKKARS